MPAAYLSPDAPQSHKDTVEYYKNVLRNLEKNEQSGLLLPIAYDPDTKQPLFKFELLSVSSGRQYDTTEIINRYDDKILVSLFSDLLRLGNNQSGSFSLASEKTSIMAMAIEARLLEIADVLNKELIPQTFALNGWKDEVFPEICFGDMEEQDLEILSKAISRYTAGGALEVDREVLNITRQSIGAAPLAEDVEPRKEYLPETDSKVGEGYKTNGEGTAKKPKAGDSSSNNTENSA